jgi:diguanylate cyclase (GGDEF)-like protein/PAS domain S-box-containing protein/putative nucleotidyltransferase with HDIG domain
MDVVEDGTADILACITDPVLVLNREGRCRFINPAAMALFQGFAGKESGGHGWTLWPLPPVLQEACEAAAHTGCPTTRVWPAPDGESWVECRVYPSETGFTLLLQDITARKREEGARQGVSERLDLIARVARNVVASAPLKAQMRANAEQIRDAFGVDACVIRALDGENLHLMGSAGVPESALFPSMPASLGIANQMITERHALAIPDVYARPGMQSFSHAPGGYQFRAYAGAPLIAEEEIVGILGIYVTDTPREFTETDLEHLQIVANYAAVSLVNDRLYQWLKAHIREREAAEAALSASEIRFKAIFENSLDAIGVLKEGAHVYGNPAYLRLFGLSDTDALTRTPIHSLLAAEAKSRIQRRFRHEARRTGEERTDLRPRAIVFESFGQRADTGTTFPIEVHGSTYTHDGETYTVLIIRDITERRRIEEAQEQTLSEALDRAERDPLTGLLNHHAFHQRLEDEARYALSAGRSFALVLMDMNNFKFFNEAYGHAAGDVVLREVANALRAFLGPNDLAARLGGDEFALLLPDIEDLSCLSQRLDRTILNLGYCPPDHATEIPIGVAAGIALFPRETVNVAEAVNLADERMRRNKYGATDAFAETTRELLTHSLQGFSMLDALVAAVDNKDRYTRRHSEEVMRYALWIAETMNLPTADRETLKVAALLHDVGKIGTPDRILRQPTALTEIEYEAMKQHAALGALLVAAVPGMEHIVPAVRHHHENWDGSGYPDGLAGEDIPFYARLLAVADTYSAMTTDRPYRKALSPEAAWLVIASGAGVQWDPNCVAAFLRATLERHAR